MSQQGYIGRNPGDGRTIVNRQTSHVTTGVQTSFTMTAGYEIGYLDVYLNGIKQTETLDYTASDGSTINFSLSFPPVNGDVLEFVAFETLNITNIKSARRNFTVGQDLDVTGNVTIGSSLTVASDLVVNGTFTTINTEILDVEDKTVGIASTSSPSNTTADGAGIVIYGGSDGDKSLTWNSTKSNFVLVGGGVSIGTGVTISTPAANVLAFSVNSAEKARFNNFGAFTVGYEGEAWHESTYVGVLQAGSGAWIGQTPGASARAEWTNNAYYDAVNTRWEYIAADEANRIVLENGELKVQSADAGSADGAITWNEKLKMTVGGDFKIGAPTGIGVTVSSSGNIDAIGIVTASSFVGNGANLTSLNASNIGSGTVPTARLGSGTASSSTFLRGDSTFQTVNTDLVSDTSPQLGGDLDANSKNIFFGDSSSSSNNRIQFGTTDKDLQIYHDGSHSRIAEGGTGNLILSTNGGTISLYNTSNSEDLAKFISNGAVELYHDNSKKLETTNLGIEITGTTNSKLAAANGTLVLESTNNDVLVEASDDFIVKVQSSELAINAIGDGAVELYHNAVKKLETTANGIVVYGPEGGGGLVNIYADEGDDNADKWRLHANPNGSFYLQNYTSGSWENSFAATGNGAGYLYYDDAVKLETVSDGIHMTKELRVAGTTVNDFESGRVRLTEGGEQMLGGYIHYDGAANVLYLGTHPQSDSTVSNDVNAISMNRTSGSNDVKLLYNGSAKLETTSWGTLVNGTFKTSGGGISIQTDGQKFTAGASDDLQLYHSGGDSYIDNTNSTGHLYIRNTYSNSHIHLQARSGEESIFIADDGEVQLYFDNAKKLATKTDGIEVTGQIKVLKTQEPQLILQDSDSGHTGAGAETGISFRDGGGTQQSIIGHHNSGSGSLFIGTNINEDVVFVHNDTNTIGIGAGVMFPFTNNNTDLGNSSLRFRNIYTNDLQLSNEGSTNSVDNTWGDYTIQEGESDLFLINNRSGKKFKFMLQEVS